MFLHFVGSDSDTAKRQNYPSEYTKQKQSGLPSKNKTVASLPHAMIHHTYNIVICIHNTCVFVCASTKHAYRWFWRNAYTLTIGSKHKIFNKNSSIDSMNSCCALNFGSCIMNKGKKRENPTLLPKLMCRISFVRHASALWTLFCRKTAPTWWTWNGICHQQRDTKEKNTNKTASDSKNALTQTLRERDTSKQWSESMKIECSNYFPVGIRCGFNMPSDSKHCFTWHIDGELKWMFFPSVTFKHSQMEKLKQTKKSLAFFAILFFC